MDFSFSYSLDNPPARALRGIETKSFAQKTFRKRLPITLTNVIDDIHRSFCSLDASQQEKIEQGKRIVHELSQLRHHLQRDKPVKMIEDNLEDSKLWQKAQRELDQDIEYTYLSLTWLFSECLVYRDVHGIIQSRSEWKDYDPFRRQKEASFKSTISGSIELSKRLAPLMCPSSVDAALFVEMLQLALWGNRADLSLINDIAAQKNMHELSNLSVETLASNDDNIISNDTEKVWEYLKSVKNQRIDIVLDNSGFELFTDLLLADWLLQHGHASAIHFHGKAMPWFISDTTRYDFNWVINECATHHDPEMKIFGQRWKGYLESSNGESPKFVFSSHQFWTTPYPFWHLMDVASDLHSDLIKSSLIIFKGDLNYRKLVYDCDWPVETNFSKAIGPLASTGPAWGAIPPFPSILALRTAKSDPIVGLEGGRTHASTLDLVDKEWRVSGRFALIQFHHSASC